VSGDFELAAADYTKALELDPKDASLLMSRAMANYVRKSFENAVSDYEKAAESGLNDVKLYHNLGDSYEKLGEAEKALKAFEKALSIDASHGGAKSAHDRLKNEFALREAEKKRREEAEAAEKARQAVAASAPPKPVDLGQINSIATDLVRPVYPPLARQMSVQGKVVVEVEIDEEGKVIAAKATEGSSSLRMASETAAKKSRFAPTVVGNKPVKAKGFITYNFRAN
jgi:TonB family protein